MTKRQKNLVITNPYSRRVFNSLLPALELISYRAGVSYITIQQKLQADYCLDSSFFSPDCSEELSEDEDDDELEEPLPPSRSAAIFL